MEGDNETMSKSIDERVVAMQFNNRQFESGVQKTLGTLERLKKGLNLDKSTRSLAGLGDATRKFSANGLSGIAHGVETIASRFSILGVMGVTALANITNQAVNTGQQLIKSLTIAPIASGMADYDRKLTSVQTIMNATGKDIKVVNAYFKELDSYADKTIYNLDDMTGAFAKFTNAGVDMRLSVPAIKGIANMTALAGQGAQAASSAMYNLSQSIAGGFLTTMDYKSLNLQNVATVEWKQQMVNAAVAAGKLKKAKNGMYMIPGAKEAIGMQQLFSEALSEGWATTEIMLKVLGDYGDETTVIGKKAQSAAQDVKSWGMMMETLSAGVGTSWTDTFEMVIGDLNESKKLFTGLTAGIGGFLGGMADGRNDMLKYWKTYGGRDVLLQTFANLFHKLDLAISPIAYSFREMFPKEGIAKILRLTNNFKYLVEGFNIGIEAMWYIGKISKGFFAALSIGMQIIKALAKNFAYLIGRLKPAGTEFRNLLANIADWLVALDSALKKGDTFNKGFKKIADFLADIINDIGLVFIDFINSFDIFNTADLKGVETLVDDVQTEFKPLEKIGQFFTAAMVSIQAVWPKIKAFLGVAWKVIGDGFNQLGVFLSNVGAKIGPALKSLSKDDIMKIFEGGLLSAILVGVLKIVKIIQSFAGGAGKFIKSVTSVFDQVRNSLKAFQTDLKANVIQKIAIAVALLAAAIILLSFIKPEKLAGGLAAVTILITELFAAMIIFQKIAGKDGFDAIRKVSFAMLLLGVAILVLTSAVKKLGKMNLEQLAKGLGGIAFILLGFAGFLKIGNFDGASFIKQAASLLILSIAVSALAGAVRKFGTMDPNVLVQGLVSIGFVLAGFAGMTQLMSKDTKMIQAAIGMMVVAIAMGKVIDAIKRIGEMKYEVMSQGITGLGFSLGIIATALTFFPKDMLKSGAGFAALAGGVIILANAIKIMGEMDPVRLTQGLLALGIALGTVVTVMNSMTAGIAGAAALVIVTGALFGLAIVIGMLGIMPMEVLAKGLGAIGAILVILGAAAVILTPALGPMALLGGALIVLGLGIAAVGGGAFVLSLGLAALTLAIVPGVPALLLLIGTFVGLVLLIPGLVALSVSLVAFSASIIVLAAAIVILGAGCFIAAPGLLLGGLGLMLLAFGLKAMETVDFSKLTSLKDYAGDVLKASGKLLLASPGLIAGGKGLWDFGNGALRTGEGLALIATNITETVNRIKEVPQDIATYGTVIVAVLMQVIQQVNALLLGAKDTIKNIMKETMVSAANQVSDMRYLWVDSGADMVEGFIGGIQSRIQYAAAAAASMAAQALRAANRTLDINSPSGKFEDVGMNSDKGLAYGIDKYAYLAEDAATKLGQRTLSPVLDMSKARVSANSISSSMSRNQNSTLSSIANGFQNGSPMQRSMDGLGSLMAASGGQQGVDLSGVLTVQVMNDKGEIIGIAQTAVRDLLRRESR